MTAIKAIESLATYLHRDCGLSIAQVVLAGHHVLVGLNGHAAAPAKPAPAPPTPTSSPNAKKPKVKPAKAYRPKRPKPPPRTSEDDRITRLEWCKQARACDITAQELCALAEEMHAAEAEAQDRVALMLAAARKMYRNLNDGKRLTRMHQAFNGGDLSMLPNFELVARNIAKDYPDLLGDGFHDSTEQAVRLYKFLDAGTPPVPVLSDFYGPALEQLKKRKGAEVPIPE